MADGGNIKRKPQGESKGKNDHPANSDFNKESFISGKEKTRKGGFNTAKAERGPKGGANRPLRNLERDDVQKHKKKKKKKKEGRSAGQKKNSAQNRGRRAKKGNKDEGGEEKRGTKSRQDTPMRIPNLRWVKKKKGYTG